MVTPLVSVLIPVYNVEPYLDECLDSVLNQTHENLRVVLVNDGSTDRSGEICDQTAKRDDRVVVIHQGNCGVAAARNVCLDNALGDFITFVDSDDFVEPTYVEHLLRLVIENRCDVASCIAWSRSSARVEKKSMPTVLTSQQALRALAGPRLAQLTVLWAKLYRADIFQGLRFPAGRLHEDTFISYRILARARRVAISDEALYFYRQPPESIMSRGFVPRGRLDASTAYCEQSVFFSAIGQGDLSRWAFKRAFGYYASVAAALARPEVREVDAQLSELAPLLRSAMHQARPSVLRRVYYQACIASPWLVSRFAAVRGGWRRVMVARILRSRVVPDGSSRVEESR